MIAARRGQTRDKAVDSLTLCDNKAVGLDCPMKMTGTPDTK